MMEICSQACLERDGSLQLIICDHQTRNPTVRNSYSKFELGINTIANRQAQQWGFI